MGLLTNFTPGWSTLKTAFKMLVINYYRQLVCGLPILIFVDAILASRYEQHIIPLGCIAIGLTGVLALVAVINEEHDPEQ